MQAASQHGDAQGRYQSASKAVASSVVMWCGRVPVHSGAMKHAPNIACSMLPDNTTERCRLHVHDGPRVHHTRIGCHRTKAHHASGCCSQGHTPVIVWQARERERGKHGVLLRSMQQRCVCMGYTACSARALKAWHSCVAVLGMYGGGCESVIHACRKVCHHSTAHAAQPLAGPSWAAAGQQLLRVWAACADCQLHIR